MSNGMLVCAGTADEKKFEFMRPAEGNEENTIYILYYLYIKKKTFLDRLLAGRKNCVRGPRESILTITSALNR
jgi:hypothetical protein